MVISIALAPFIFTENVVSSAQAWRATANMPSRTLATRAASTSARHSRNFETVAAPQAAARSSPAHSSNNAATST